MKNKMRCWLRSSQPYANKTLTDTDVATLQARKLARSRVTQTQSTPRISAGMPYKAANAAKLAAAQTMGKAAAASVRSRLLPGGLCTPSSCPLGDHDRRGQARPVGLTPGQAEAANVIGGARACDCQANNLYATRGLLANPQGSNLENLRRGYRELHRWPWSRLDESGESLGSNRNILPRPECSPTRSSIASQEAAFTESEAEQLAQQQFATIGGTGTDAKFGSAFKSNPNETLSAMGNKGIINLPKGTMRMRSKPKNGAFWQKWLAA